MAIDPFVLGIGAVGQNRDARTYGRILDIRADRFDPPPAFMSRGAGRERVVEPRASLPNRKIRGADAAAFQLDPNLPRSRRGYRDGCYSNVFRSIENRRHAACRIGGFSYKRQFRCRCHA